MRLRSPTARAVHAFVLLLVAVSWSVLVATWHLDGRETFVDRLEFASLDARFLIAGPRPAPPDVIVVALDDEAIRALGAYPIPRPALAKLLRRIAEQHPRAIGLDVLLLDPGSEEADAGLQGALRETGTVIAAAATFPRAPGAAVRAGPADLPVAERVLEPLARFQDGIGFGLVNVASDHNGTPRHLPLLIAVGDRLLPAFMLQVAARGARSEVVLEPATVGLGGVATRLDLGLSLPLRFYGPRGSVRTISAAAILRGEGGPNALRDRIVVVGVTASGAGDTFATPYDPLLPGIEVLATGIAHLVTGDGLVRDRRVRRVDAAAAVVLAVGGGLVLAFAPSGLGTGLVALAAAGWLGIAVTAFANGVWLAAMMPLAAVAPVIVVGLAGRIGLDRRDARRRADSERALRAFHPPEIAARLARDPGFLADPEVRDASIVFVDLSGFTGLSERLGPRGTQTFLKGFHALVDGCVTRHGGLVLSFMGDGAMCVFGLSGPDPRDARRALDAALDVVPEVRKWLASYPDAAGSVDLRVGAHHGEVVLSRLGSRHNQHITATGDSVNLASRLMEAGKSLGAALVVSEDLVTAAGASIESTFEGRRTMAIRGRVQPLTVAYRWRNATPAADDPST